MILAGLMAILTSSCIGTKEKPINLRTESKIIIAFDASTQETMDSFAETLAEFVRGQSAYLPDGIPKGTAAAAEKTVENKLWVKEQIEQGIVSENERGYLVLASGNETARPSSNTFTRKLKRINRDRYALYAQMVKDLPLILELAEAESTSFGLAPSTKESRTITPDDIGQLMHRVNVPE